MGRKLLPFLAAVATFSVVLAAGAYIDSSENARYRAHQEAMLAEHMAALRAGLEQVLNANLSVVDGLAALVGTCRVCGESEYRAYVRAVAEGRPAVRAVQLAPDAVVAFVHPEEGNEGIRGLDLRTLPGQADTVERTIAERRFLLAGPVQLRQGGTGLIGRRPIHLPARNGDAEEFWGFATVILDFQRLLESAGWQELGQSGRFALRGVDGRGGRGAPFLGDPALFGQAPLTLDVSFPQGSWQLAAVPLRGWVPERPGSSEFRTALALLSLAAGVAGFLLVRLYRDRRDGQMRLLEASRLKSSFMARMSHELRTPLNAIIGFSEVMATQSLGPMGNSRYVEYAEDIRYSGRHLLEVVNAILDMEKAESGQLEIHPEATSLAAHCREVVRLLRQRAEMAGLSLEVEIERGMPNLMADPRALRDMLINLLSNAIKFTERGGRVVLLAESRPDGGQRVTVIDSGIGIPPEDLNRVLSPFGQVDSEQSRRHKGTGLGLPLTKALIDLHGGSLEIRSAPGKGTAVTLAFPATPRTAAAQNETAPRGAVPETV
jgi:two-component system sensor histidine kinase ChiS